MSFQYDSTGIKDEFPLLPDAWYDFKIIEAEERVSSKGNNMILAKCQVINNPEVDEVLWHYVTFLSPDSKGAWINVSFRKAIGVPAGGNDTVDAEDWLGKRFKGYVTSEIGQDGIKRNKIQKVSPMPETTKPEVEAALALHAPAKRKPVAAKVKDDEDIPF